MPVEGGLPGDAAQSHMRVLAILEVQSHCVAVSCTSARLSNHHKPAIHNALSDYNAQYMHIAAEFQAGYRPIQSIVVLPNFLAEG